MRHRRRLPLFVVALCLAAGPYATAEDDERSTAERRVDDLVKSHGVRANGPGVAVLAVDGEGVQLKRCYGLANLATKTPIDSATTFELASVSKQIAGSAVMLLVHRGKVRVGDDVRTHLPELPVYDAKHPITVDHLSRHTSGLPDYLAWEGEAATKRPYWTNADVVVEFARRKESSPLEFTPGERYEYSNSGYMLLGALVERVSGQTFGTFLAKEFFGPLGMKHAWVHESPRVPTSAVAVGYTREDGEWTPTWSAPTAQKHEKLFTTGDGSVWASLDDMERWDFGLRNGIPVPTATMLRALKPGRTLSGKRVAYAMGWNLECDDDDEVTAVSHSGTWGGFESYIAHDATHDVTAVVLSNRGGFDAEKLCEAVLRLYRD